ncbi:MAG: pentapeptide repeat-containing protein [Ekhidna sp.]|nr:pentapeptide repeat-containing protein [Ekhidna sp.]
MLFIKWFRNCILDKLTVLGLFVLIIGAVGSIYFFKELGNKELENSKASFFLTIAGGGILLLGAGIARRTLQAQVRLNFASRLKEGVELLNSDNPGIQMGAVNLLDALIQDKDIENNEKIMITHSFCAFVRCRTQEKGYKWYFNEAKSAYVHSVMGDYGLKIDAAGTGSEYREYLYRKFKFLYNPAVWLAIRRVSAKEAKKYYQCKRDDGLLNFTGAYLPYLYLPKAQLAHARMEMADLRSAIMEESNFEEANLQRADISRARLKKSDFRKAKLQGIYLQCVKLEGADLQGADLGHAHLQGTDLREADLQGASLQGTKLQGAKLKSACCINVSFTKTILDEHTNMECAVVDSSTVCSLPTDQQNRVITFDGEQYTAPANTNFQNGSTATDIKEVRKYVEDQIKMKVGW